MCVDVSQIHLQYYKKLPRISSVDRQQIKKLQCWEVKKLFTTRFYLKCLCNKNFEVDIFTNCEGLAFKNFETNIPTNHKNLAPPDHLDTTLLSNDQP